MGEENNKQQNNDPTNNAGETTNVKFADAEVLDRRPCDDGSKEEKNHVIQAPGRRTAPKSWKRWTHRGSRRNHPVDTLISAQ